MGWLDRADAVAEVAGRPTPAEDRAIFNFALLLEYVQASFYDEALAHGRLKGDLRDFAAVARDHEHAHVHAIKQALGSHARPKPRLNFGHTTRDPRSFQSTAVALEDLAVAAYNEQAANLTRDGLAAAIEIVSVEARHAAWIRAIAGEEPAPTAADPGEDAAAVTSRLRKLDIR